MSSKHILFQHFCCHLALSQLLLCIIQFIPSCATLLFVRLLILLRLAQAAISGPVVTAGTWVPVLADTVSEISKKFLFHGNTPLLLLDVCVCVMSTWGWQMQSSWNSGTKSTVLLLVFRENKGNGFPTSTEDSRWKTKYVHYFLALLLCGC